MMTVPHSQCDPNFIHRNDIETAHNVFVARGGMAVGREYLPLQVKVAAKVQS